MGVRVPYAERPWLAFEVFNNLVLDLGGKPSGRILCVEVGWKAS